MSVPCARPSGARITTLLTFLFLLVVAPAQAQQGQVSGRVVAAENGQPIPGAAITAAGQSRWTSTSADGRFTLVLPAGSYTISAEALGYRAGSLVVSITSGGSATADFSLATRPLALEGIQVSTLRPDLSPTAALEGRAVQEANPTDAGDLLRAIDGVDAVRRGPLGLDPVVRGLRETEVGAYLDGTRMFPAGPARMDSPLTHLDPSAVRSIEVVKGPYALTWGPGNLAAIRVETQQLPSANSAARGSIGAGYDTNVEASETVGKVYGRAGGLGYAVNGAWRQGNDYESGNGSPIPGDFESWDVRGKVGLDIGGDADLVLSAGYQEQGPIDYPGRLLTAQSFEAMNLNARFALRPSSGGALQEVQLQAYMNDVDHGMDNTGKPTRMAMPSRVPPFALDVTVQSAMQVVGGRAAAEIGLGSAATLEVGGDYMDTNRDATRFIRNLDTGMLMFEDMMWPDATIQNVGGFGRVTWASGALRLAGSGRVDFVSAEAPTASAFFLSNVGSDLTSYETNLSAAGTAALDLDEHWTLTVGAGSVVRTADASERYSDRIPSSKAQFAAEFMGNPDLKPERSTQADLWIDGRFESVAVHLSAFTRKIDDYITIQATGLPRRLPLSPMTVFQYVNGEATFHGLDFSLTAGITELLTSDVRVSYLRGTEGNLDEPAFGVSPMSASLGFRWEESEGRFYAETALNAVGGQDRVSTSRNEGVTPSYVTGDVRAGYGLPNGVTLRGGVLNSWNEEYYHHLNARNPFTGAQVPEPGRVFFIDAVWSF